ncbi:hypothetical protein Bphy_7762 (plasmid) [Paraburkholderia phymatum STM815]|uniref:Uncharacterized protein n=1 Tax=Paraburkholderia phymatum (strain DSM 17167 / CIP 108236 / LMG 21445 / STM815) TaxID=391038 RepID=B2JYD9_PARP8|nr:hypothetical protein Bphy_7762 [Paraburkholderia phymatum STM815]
MGFVVVSTSQVTSGDAGDEMRFIATIASRRSPSVALRARTTASVEPAYNKTLLLEWSVVVRYEIFGRWVRYVRRSFAPCGQIGSPRIPHHTTSEDVLERFAAHAFASRRRERLEGKSVPLKSGRCRGVAGGRSRDRRAEVRAARRDALKRTRIAAIRFAQYQFSGRLT